MTKDLTVVEEQVAEFHCSVDANPFTEDTVSWSLPDRPGGFLAWRNRKEVIVDPLNKTSVLKIHFVNRDDMGRVVCSANNGVRGLERSKTSRLTVLRKL